MGYPESEMNTPSNPNSFPDTQPSVYAMILAKAKKVIRTIVDSLYQCVSDLLPRKKPLPMSFWRALRSLFFFDRWGKNPLLKHKRVPSTTGANLEFGSQAFLNSKDILGTWSLDGETIRLLWDLLITQKPAVIIECGSGISTMILAAYASRMQEDENLAVKIVSLEQDESESHATRNRLLEHGLDGHVRVVHAPLDDNASYTANTESLLEATDGRLADWVIVDGPSGSSGCRVHTLPLVAACCKNGAHWYLDDAFRDGELSVLKSWQNTKGLAVHGIYAVGKGLAAGQLNI